MKASHDSACLFEFGASKELVLRFKDDVELVQSLTDAAKAQGVKAGTFTAIGALKRAKLGYYDQRSHEYRTITIEAAMELASCTGNVSIKGGEVFVHAHAVLSDENGNTRAGHLLEGIVFAAEVHLTQLEGPRLERKYDKASELMLWASE
jgi:uncharacterized protein